VVSTRLKKMSKWKSSPNRGENKTYMKTPPRFAGFPVSFQSFFVGFFGSKRPRVNLVNGFGLPTKIGLDSPVLVKAHLEG